MVRRGWKQWDEEQARRELSDFRESGEPREEFARRRGYSAERLRRWSQRLESATVALSPSPPPLLLPVRLRSEPERSAPVSPRAASPVEVVLRSGRLLRVHPGFDAAALAALVQTLESVPC